MKRTKIICTIGPSSKNPVILKELIRNGMNVARLNCSHGDYQEKLEKIKAIRSIDETIGIMLDTKGPEIRTGDFDKEYYLKQNSKITIKNKDIIGNENKFSITYKNLHNIVKKGNRILLDDGLIELVVLDIKNKDIICKVINSGNISSRKGVNLPDCEINMPSITKKDIEDIEFGIKNKIDFIAVSFVKSADDINKVKKILKKHKAENIEVIAKIEHKKAIENIKEIISVADGVMIARGDLAVEYNFEKIPLIQREIIKQVTENGKYSIVATQMLESMIKNSRPTRAEVTDVANAVLLRADCVMLSGETAKGSYPVESIKAMSKIIKEVEENIYKNKIFDKTDSNYSENIARSTVYTLNQLNIEKVIVPTNTGYSARLISKYRPNAKIYSLVFCKDVLRKLSIIYGVEGYMVNKENSFSKIILNGLKILLKNKKINKEETVLITGGYKNEKTNSLIINKVSNFFK
ncbi:MAG TPA: pyruvate kinase [Candidatus Diapherotrites archaeon]|nr:pyruvate kinase [Candidatus Diapherotrites archaeon]